jgi:hypothetical protein
LNNGFDFNFGGGQGGSQGQAFAFERTTGNGLWKFNAPEVGPELNIFASPYGTAYLAPQGWPASLANTAKHVTDAVGDAFTNLLRNHRTGPLAAYPLYAQVHSYAVHVPIQPRPDLLAKYNAKPVGVRHSRPAYAALTEGLDQLVGRVMVALQDPDGNGDTSDSIVANTLLIFTSDNGGERNQTNNAPLRSAKGSLYEGGLRVPFIARRPGVIPTGAVSGRMIHPVDFYRTLCEVAGVSVPAGSAPDSESFATALAQPTTAPQRGPIFYHFPGYLDDRASPCSTIIKEIGARRYKLISYYETGAREMYDLTNDLSETKNLLDGNYWNWQLHGAAARELAVNLSAWLQQPTAGWQPSYPTVRATGEVLGPPSGTVDEVVVPFTQSFHTTAHSTDIPARQVTLSWVSLSGYEFAIDGSDDLMNWSPLAVGIVATSATTTRTIGDVALATARQRFYRVRLTGG